MARTNGDGGLRQWCREHGVAPSSLHRALVAGHVARLASGTLDTRSAARWLAARRAPRAVGRSGAPRAGSVAAAQRKLIEYRARLARLEYRRRSGELLDAREVEAAAHALGARVRQRLEAIAPRVAPAAAGLDADAVHEVIAHEVNAALDELSDGLAQVGRMGEAAHD